MCKYVLFLLAKQAQAFLMDKLQYKFVHEQTIGILYTTNSTA